ncbi:MAG TPA: METTL5 family protein [Candidatus Nanoarchaeia archaeon]|nr:METTL5 family protein [Candidatus Nanoarchaeia archaeon]
MTFTKKELAIHLSHLQTFAQPSASLEQYATNSELAAQILWDAHLQGDITDKVVADFGCGPGIFGLGALLLGAKKVYFVDIDAKALALAKTNLHFLNTFFNASFSASFSHQEVSNFRHHVDTILQNPPFGVQQEHADRPFLEKAMVVGNVIYTLHKIESKSFLTTLTSSFGFRITALKPLLFPLPKTQTFHRKKAHAVAVGLWRLERL